LVGDNIAGAAQSSPDMPVLSVEGLHVSFFTEAGEAAAVQDVSFELARGKTLAVVGESGCGKSVTALSILGLIDTPGRITAGSIRLNGEELIGRSEKELREVRGSRIGMVFQEPMTSLNPVFTIGFQIGEVLKRHRGMDENHAREESVRLLRQVGIPSPERRVDQYPHELSGGMKQRAMIAMALACHPDLLIADEPTTAVDVTIQAQILQLLQELQKDMGMSVLLITHNLGVVAHFAQRVVVMYAGQVAESADVQQLFAGAAHPYTRALLAALPRPGHKGERLVSIEGTVPAPQEYARGCRFCTRCPEVMERCADEIPPRTELVPGHTAACWRLVGDER
jgi:oligopeptide/dipeptide ABC transporter ATP-binding protein